MPVSQASAGARRAKLRGLLKKTTQSRKALDKRQQHQGQELGSCIEEGEGWVEYVPGGGSGALGRPPSVEVSTPSDVDSVATCGTMETGSSTPYNSNSQNRNTQNRKAGLKRCSSSDDCSLASTCVPSSEPPTPESAATPPPAKKLAGPGSPASMGALQVRKLQQQQPQRAPTSSILVAPWSLSLAPTMTPAQPQGGGGGGSSGGSSTSSGGGSTGAPPMRLFALSGNAAAPDAHQLYQEARQRHRASSVSAAPPAPPAQQFHASPPSDGSAAPQSSSGGGSGGSISSSAWGYMATRSARQADVHHAARVARLSETASRPPAPPVSSGSPAHSAASSGGGGAAAAQEDARGRSRSVRRWGLSSRGRRKRADAATAAAAAGAADAAAAAAVAAAGAEAVGAGMKSVSSARAASSSLAAAAVAAAAALGPRTPSRLRRGRVADAEPRQRVEAGVTISRSRSRGRAARSSEQAIERSLSIARGCCAPLLPLSVSPVPLALRAGAAALPPLQPPLLPPPLPPTAVQEAPPPHLAYAPHYSSATSDFEFLGRWSPSKRHRGSSSSGGGGSGDDAWSGGASRRLRRAAAAPLDGGGFSQLWLARDRATGKSYLAKVFNVARLAGAGVTCATKVLTTIAAERRVLEGLWCPYLASSLATLRDESHLYMVTNVAPSDDLGTRLARDGRLDGAAAAFAFAQIVEAVAHMHARGIAHRALAPEAVVVDAEGHVKLTNFGSAKAHVRSATSGCRTVCGRDPYSAPEVCFGVTPYGLAADWWSAGVLLHALLTGKVPVPTVMLPDLDEEVSACLAAAPAYVSAAAADCVQRLLQWDPARRLGGGAAGATAVKAHPLFAHIDWPTLARCGYDSPLASRPPRPAPHAPLPFRSQPLALAPIKTAVANFSAPPQAAQSPQSWGMSLFNFGRRATSKSPTE